jgi:protein SCO1/2
LCLDLNQAFRRFFWTEIRARFQLIPKAFGVLPMQKFALIVCLALALPGCERSTNRGEAAQHYETRGIVRGFSPDRRTIEIEHENIPGFMPSMTMPFSVRDQKEIVDLRTGDAISFRMTVTEKDFWIDRVHKINRNAVQLPGSRATPRVVANETTRLGEGAEIPAFTLTNQDGQRITRESFRGRPFVLTFIFTRCPIPSFCPRMSNNFADLQSAIKAGTGKLAKTRLLSITLDPDFDTPQVLKEHSAHLHVDPDVWNLATSDSKEIDALTQAFSVYRQAEGGTISHGLATALIDEDGKIDKVWRGNGWKPAEVIEEIKRRE